MPDFLPYDYKLLYILRLGKYVEKIIYSYYYPPFLSISINTYIGYIMALFCKISHN